MSLRAALTLVAVAVPAHADSRKVFTNTDEVRACLPLAGGDVLVGTGGGLARVDAAGATRRVWTASDGLPGTRVDALVADGNRVWVATDAGVAEFSDHLVRAVAGKPVRDVARFHGDVYLATWDGGVVKLGGGDVAMRGGGAATRMRVSSLAIAGGALWAGTAAGLYRLRGDHFEKTDGPKDIASLAGDGDTLWIGAADGWWRADQAAPVPLGGGEVRHLARLDGKLVGAGADGITAIDRGHVIVAGGAPRGFAQTIAGGHGAACSGGLDGLWLRGETWKHVPLGGGPPSNDISAIVADGERIWVGTFDQGLAVYDKGWRRIANIDTRINALALGGDGTLWVATAQGLAAVDRAGTVVAKLGRTEGLPSRSVLSVTKLGDGRIVAGTSAGAAFVEGGKARRVGPRGSGDKGVGNVWAIAELGGSLWLGTTTGMYRGPATAWTTKDGADDAQAIAERWQRFSVATGHLKDDWVTAIVLRGTSLYAGTYNGGVVRFDGDTATPLGGGWVNPSGLTWDGDRLLAATQEGLVAGDGMSTTWTPVRELPAKDVTASLRAGKILWIATRRGLVAID